MTNEEVIAAFRRDIERIEKGLNKKIDTYAYRQEMDDVKGDISRLEGKLDRIIEGQNNNNRMWVIQLVMIIVTLAVAAFGAIS